MEKMSLYKNGIVTPDKEEYVKKDEYGNAVAIQPKRNVDMSDPDEWER